MNAKDLSVIDAHQHFWDPGAADYPWMAGADPRLRKPYGPSDLAPLLASTGVEGTVVVQARHTFSETHSLLEIAANTPWVVGVVGWIDLTRPDADETIARIREGDHGRWLVGFRHLVHDEDDPEWLMRDDVQRGLNAIADAGLVYDLLVRTRELPAAIEIGKRLPHLRFVVDHLAKPAVARHEVEPWASTIAGLADLSNVVCKVSGLVTEADWSSWKPADLLPYLEKAVDLFGARRLMFGSDWPVCTLAASYMEVVEVTIELVSDLAGDDLDSVFRGCAVATYGLDPGEPR